MSNFCWFIGKFKTSKRHSEFNWHLPVSFGINFFNPSFAYFTQEKCFITANWENCNNKILFLYLFQLSRQYKMAEFGILFFVIKGMFISDVWYFAAHIFLDAPVSFNSNYLFQCIKSIETSSNKFLKIRYFPSDFKT